MFYRALRPSLRRGGDSVRSLSHGRLMLVCISTCVHMPIKMEIRCSANGTEWNLNASNCAVLLKIISLITCGVMANIRPKSHMVSLFASNQHTQSRPINYLPLRVEPKNEPTRRKHIDTACACVCASLRASTICSRPARAI